MPHSANAATEKMHRTARTRTSFLMVNLFSFQPSWFGTGREARIRRRPAAHLCDNARWPCKHQALLPLPYLTAGALSVYVSVLFELLNVGVIVGLVPIKSDERSVQRAGAPAFCPHSGVRRNADQQTRVGVVGELNDGKRNGSNTADGHLLPIPAMVSWNRLQLAMRRTNKTTAPQKKVFFFHSQILRRPARLGVLASAQSQGPSPPEILSADLQVHWLRFYSFILPSIDLC